MVHAYSTVGNVPPKTSRARAAPPVSAVRRLATGRDFGTPMQLVVLFRAPPPVLMVAGRMWISAACDFRSDDALARRVTVVGSIQGISNAVLKVLAVWRTRRWVGYIDDIDFQTQIAGQGAEAWVRGGRGVLTTGPLDPRERDITWAWGWKSKSAKALRVMEALR